MATLADVRAAQPCWFGHDNQAFFGDLEYYVMEGGKSGQAFLVRLTNAWTDMFGAKKKKHYRINPLDKFLKIRPLVDDIFGDMDDVENWLEEN